MILWWSLLSEGNEATLLDLVSDVYNYLNASGLVGGSTGWALIRRKVSDAPTPDQCVIISEDGGPPSEQWAAEGIGDSAMRDPAVHIMVRGKPWDGDASGYKALEIYNLMHSKRGITMGSHYYFRIQSRTASPLFLGFDERGRPQHTLSFLCLADA